MAYETIPPLEGRYSNIDRYDRPRSESYVHLYGPLYQPQHNAYFEKFKLDAALLKEALSPDVGRPDATVAEEVFGGQARQQRIGLGHTANVLYERALLHKKQLAEIDQRLMEFKDRLSVMKMLFPSEGGGRTQQHLEKLIITLEKQRREEEQAFWNDSVGVREKLFEGASTYTAARNRYSIFSRVEGEHG